MVAHVLSYLLGPDPMLVTSFHDSDGNLINQHSTTAQLQGPRYGHTKDVAQPINPVTGANWEGNGVEPDIAVPASDALDTALGRARR